MSRIAIIDDSLPIRKTIRMVLEKEGHEVFEAADGKEGEKLINETTFDIILLDIVMPQKSGCDLLLSMKNKLKNTEVIILTGNVDPQSDIKKNLARQFNVRTVLLKPFRKTQLLDAINNALKNSKSLPPSGSAA